MKDYFKRFLKEEDGAELIEIAISIGIVAVLAFSLYAIVQVSQSKMEDAGKAIEGIDIGSPNSNGTGGGTGGAGGAGTGGTGAAGNGTGGTGTGTP